MDGIIGMNDLVSVIIPTYNREDTIFNSIMSVIKQTYTNIEIIVYDDGSTDNTKEIVKNINDCRIKYYRGINGGAGYARNMGIKYATGEYIAFHDSDDICRPYRIEHQIKFLKENNFDMVYAQLERHAYENSKLVNIYPEDGRIGNTIEETYKNFITRSSVWTQVVLCKAKCCKEILFDVTLPAMEDWEWSLRMAKKYRIGWSPEVVVDSYITENSISRSSHNKMLTLKRMYDTYYSDIDKYGIHEEWEWMIAFYIYNDHPETHIDYGEATIKMGLKYRELKKVIEGIAYILYISPIKTIVKVIKTIWK